MKRSIFKKGESFNDVMQSLNQAETPEDYRHLISERLKSNGWTKEAELNFRRHCETVGFILPGQSPKAGTLAKNIEAGPKSRLFADAIRNDLRQSRIVGDVEAVEERQAIQEEQ